MRLAAILPVLVVFAASHAADEAPLTLRSARVAFDTSARTPADVRAVVVGVTVEGIAGSERSIVASRSGMAVATTFDAATTFDLDVVKSVDRNQLEGVRTRIAVGPGAGEVWTVHCSVVLTFEGDGASVVVAQKAYAVVLGAGRPEHVEETALRPLEKRKAKGEEKARRELEALYAQMDAAIESNDADALLRFQPQLASALDVRGQPATAEDRTARARLALGPARPPIFAHHEVGGIALNGTEAIVTVRQEFSRMMRISGTVRKVESSVTQDESWVRTSKGWVRRAVENEQDIEWLVDGKAVDPAKPLPG